MSLGDLRTPTERPLGKVHYEIYEREEDSVGRAAIRGQFTWDGSVNVFREYGCFRLATQSGENLHVEATYIEGASAWPQGRYSVDFFSIHPPLARGPVT